MIVHIFPGKATFFPGQRRSYYIRLVAANGRTLAVSEAYASLWGARRAARKNFPEHTAREVAE